jgi:class 3 adenylate cyclase/pimeloyl-ACP methyl ester carboxylesterase
MTAPPETHYARSGDVSIAYQVTGEGPFDVVYAPPFISNVELAWEVPEMASFYERLSSFCRLIRFDKRGQGMSDRVSGVPTLETRMDDVRAVMDAVGSQRAALVGISEGTPMSILFAATYPERVWALALCGSFARARWAPDYPMGTRDEEIRLEDEEIEHKWGSAEHSAATGRSLLPDGSEESVAAFARLLRQSASPGAALALNRMNNEIDVRAALPLIRAPTVVIYRENEDPFITEGSRYIVERIPAAQERVLPGTEHAPYAGATQAYTDAIRDFFIAAWEHGAGEKEEHDRVLATILFTDIVGSTAKAAELGDRRWRELLEEHHALVRRQLLRYRGTELDTAGDGFFASFDGPARAIRCARAITTSVDELGIQVRAGVHTGECERMNGKVGGIAVHIGARVAAEAGPGEVVVSGTVKDLVAGSGIEFRDRGAAELKGVPGEWRLFAVEAA